VVRKETKPLFQNRFTKTNDFQVRLGTVGFKTLTYEENIMLSSNITKEEVKSVVW